MKKTNLFRIKFVFLFILFSISAGAQQIGHTTVTYIDASRSNRPIETEIYYPSPISGDNTPITNGIYPLIVCGHGFVMTWSTYQNIWTSLVPEGYIVAFPKTEGGFSPSHSNFGLDLKFLVNQIQNNGARTIISSSNVGQQAAIMGHSMGGGAAFLAGQNNTSIATIITFAAANTNPSAITAAQQTTVPTLVFSGANDCITLPNQHQDLMYNNSTAAYKTQIYITGGSHCYFADFNFNCNFGEITCSPSPTITRSEQQNTTNVFLKLWLAYYLTNNCTKAQEFQNLLITSNTITSRQNQSIACTVLNSDVKIVEESFSVYPNPTNGTFTINSSIELEKIIIYDFLGRQIMVINNPELTEILNLNSISEGIYTISCIDNNNKLFSKKLIVKQ